MDKNSNYWQEDFILQFSMQIQEAIKEQRDNNKRDYTVSNNKGGDILWLKISNGVNPMDLTRQSMK